MGDRAAVVAVIVLLSACAPAPSGEDPALYDHALQAERVGDYPKARTSLDRLIREHPEFYKAYPERWLVIGHMSDHESTTNAVRRDLQFLESIPADRRGDDLYRALMEGNDWLGLKERKETWRKEAIARLPKGRIARLARLEAAEEENDVLRSAAMYEAFLDEFQDDADLAAGAALDRFRVLAGHADRFDTRSLVEAAARWETIAASGAMHDRDPDQYYTGLLTIAEALVERAPDRSIDYAHKGIALVEEAWAVSEDIDEEDRLAFWPILARAYGAAGNWQTAVKFEGALVAAIESNRISSLHLRQIGEASARTGFARALEQTGAIEQARLQFGLAAALDDALKSGAADFALRHPPGTGGFERFESRLASETRRMLTRRRDHARTEVLAAEVRRPAPEFTLKDLAGRSVSLSDLRGKTVVVAFWATWCGPCEGEMQELELAQRANRRDPRVAFVGVSIDMDKAQVPPYIERQGITFPILLSDGTVERFYVPHGIPQLYVLDPEAQIRFDQTGWIHDEFDRSRLGWMIEAARR